MAAIKVLNYIIYREILNDVPGMVNIIPNPAIILIFSCPLVQLWQKQKTRKNKYKINFLMLSMINIVYDFKNIYAVYFVHSYNRLGIFNNHKSIK